MSFVVVLDDYETESLFALHFFGIDLFLWLKKYLDFICLPHLISIPGSATVWYRRVASSMFF